MALSADDPLLWGIVFLLVFLAELAVLANLRHGGTKVKYEASSRAAVLVEGEQLTDVLSRFVMDAGGKRVGETIGMDGELVIVKGAGELSYHAVPRAKLTRTDDGFRAAGDMDWTEAARLGGEWREKQHRVVTYQTDELPDDERPAA